MRFPIILVRSLALCALLFSPFHCSLNAAPLGVVVCEPVAARSAKAVADFGAGCGRWLFFTVGGQSGLSRTPLWSDVERAPQELGRRDLRLTLTDAAQLSRIVGATHAAVGTITGTAAHCTLTYRVYRLPGRSPLGPPLQADGSEAQIVASLPGMAQGLMRRLGLDAPRPAAPQARPTQMALIGRIPWGPVTGPSEADEESLLTLAPHLPLAGLLALNLGGDRHTPDLGAVAETLLRQAPGNPLVYGQVAFMHTGPLLPPSTALGDRRHRFPRCYGFAHAAVWVGSVAPDAREQDAAQQAVHDAPRNPDAWLAWGRSNQDVAQALRKGRAAEALTPQEWSRLGVLYAQWLRGAQMAVHLDPHYGRAWLRAAEAATFAGQSTVADGALWKALRLDPDRAGVYYWGLEMYQEKWDSDPAKLAKVAALAAADHYPSVTTTIGVAKDLVGAGFSDQAKTLMDRCIADARDAVQEAPNDVFRHWELALAYLQQKRNPEAVPELQAALHLAPNMVGLHNDLGYVYQTEGQMPAAIAEYQAALRLRSDLPQTHFNLGWCLLVRGQLSDAEHELRQADPADARTHDALGEVFLRAHRDLEAIAEYQEALRLAPDYPSVYRPLFGLLYAHGRYDEAIEVGQKVLRGDSNDTATMANISDSYLHKKKWQDAIATSEATLKVNPNDAIAHENLGEAYIGEGDRTKAREEWALVLKYDHDGVANVARDYLAKYPAP